MQVAAQQELRACRRAKCPGERDNCTVYMRAARRGPPPPLFGNVDDARWRSYLQRVYRSEEPLPTSTASRLLERSFWFYHTAPFDEVECFHKQESALNMRQVCAVGPSGLRVVVRHVCSA